MDFYTLYLIPCEESDAALQNPSIHPTPPIPATSEAVSRTESTASTTADKTAEISNEIDSIIQDIENYMQANNASQMQIDAKDSANVSGILDLIKPFNVVNGSYRDPVFTQAERDLFIPKNEITIMDFDEMLLASVGDENNSRIQDNERRLRIKFAIEEFQSAKAEEDNKLASIENIYKALCKELNTSEYVLTNSSDEISYDEVIDKLKPIKNILKNYKSEEAVLLNIKAKQRQAVEVLEEALNNV